MDRAESIFSLNHKTLEGLRSEIQATTSGLMEGLPRLDGRPHYFKTIGADKKGWYIGTQANGYWICTYGCYKQDIKATAYSHKGISKTERDHLSEAQAEVSRQHQEDEQRARKQAERKARAIWHLSVTDCSPSEYLKQKQVSLRCTV